MMYCFLWFPFYERINTFSPILWLFRNISPDEKYGPLFVFSLRLALSMQIIGFSVRFLSSFLWIQMYRLGLSSVDSAAYHEADFDVRNSFLNPSTDRQTSNSDEFLGGSIYDPAYYSSLFEDAPDKRCRCEVSFLHNIWGIWGHILWLHAFTSFLTCQLPCCASFEERCGENSMMT